MSPNYKERATHLPSKQFCNWTPQIQDLFASCCRACVFVFFQFLSSWTTLQVNSLVYHSHLSPFLPLCNCHIISSRYQVFFFWSFLLGVLGDSQLILLYSNKEQWSTLCLLWPEEVRSQCSSIQRLRISVWRPLSSHVWVNPKQAFSSVALYQIISMKSKFTCDLNQRGSGDILKHTHTHTRF